MTDKNVVDKKVEEVEEGSPTLTGIGSWGVVYALTGMLMWCITNGASDKIVGYLLLSVMVMWLIKLFERRLSGIHELEFMKTNLSNAKK